MNSKHKVMLNSKSEEIKQVGQEIEDKASQNNIKDSKIGMITFKTFNIRRGFQTDYIPKKATNCQNCNTSSLKRTQLPKFEYTFI